MRLCLRRCFVDVFVFGDDDDDDDVSVSKPPELQRKFNFQGQV